MILYDGPYVNGLFVPSAVDEKDAFKQAKSALIETYIKAKAKKSEDGRALKHVKGLLRSFKKYWRINRNSKVINIQEYNTPFECGYWLSLPGTQNQHLCNILR